MEGYKVKRDAVEWTSPIVKTILIHENYTSIDTLYKEVPINIYPQLTEYERRPSGKAGEWEWRGNLRTHLSNLVRKEKILKRNYVGRKPWFSVIRPEEWHYLLE